MRTLFSLLILSCLSCLNMGCSSTHPHNTQDPLETYNRTAHGFNTAIDKVIIRPIAQTYTFVIPRPIDQGVGNFFSNFNQVTTIANDILQADARYTIRDTWRFAINSTIGLLGIFDVASRMGLEKHTEDFGLTLAKWGIKDSPYFVLPFLGPSTLRDAFSLPIDYYALSPWPYVKSSGTRYGMYGLQTIHQRRILLGTDRVIKEAFDPYVFVRSAYLQRRAYLMENKNKTEVKSETN